VVFLLRAGINGRKLTTKGGSAAHGYPAREAQMFSLVKILGVQLTLKREALPFGIAFLIAEFFYKFHSFALECLAFLMTWYVLSFVQSLIWAGSEESPRRQS
jgi:hypothetical protein